MAHQCKVRYTKSVQDEIDGDWEQIVEEEIFEQATHVTTTPENGTIVKYLDENQEEQIRYFNSKDIIAVHSR